MVGIFDTGIANIPVHTRKEQIHVLFGPATNTTFLIYLFSHYFFVVSQYNEWRRYNYFGAMAQQKTDILG
jgi:hypothetical protein